MSIQTCDSLRSRASHGVRPKVSRGVGDLRSGRVGRSGDRATTGEWGAHLDKLDGNGEKSRPLVNT